MYETTEIYVLSAADELRYALAAMRIAGALPTEKSRPLVFTLIRPASVDQPIGAVKLPGGCGGGRIVRIDGTGEVSHGGASPTHCIVRVRLDDDDDGWLVVDKGSIGVDPWPGADSAGAHITFKAVRGPQAALVKAPAA